MKDDPVLESPAHLADRLSLCFNDLNLLNKALTHRSYVNESPEVVADNERLEFLGDAVLDFLVASWLFKRFPQMAEGDLTRLRAALVGTRQLSDFSRKLRLGNAVLLGRGERESGGRRRDSILCGVFEAVIGAIYLDSGMEAVWKLIEPLLESVTDDILENRKDRDAKSRLQEWAQGNGLGVPVYHLIEVTGPDHDKSFEFEVRIGGIVHGRGVGSSKQAASKAAAGEALRFLEIQETSEK